MQKVLTLALFFLASAYAGIIEVPAQKSDFWLLTVPRDEVTFRLWTRNNKNSYRSIYYAHLHEEDSFRLDKPFKIIIHGWTDYADKEWITDIKNEYLEKEDCNVIAVDWKKPASALYPFSVKYTRDVGTYVGELIVDFFDTLKVPFSNFHLIGHSLGSHISGFAGQHVQKERRANIGRITGMDPAGPLFLLAGENDRLSTGDADFVDIIHTDGGKFGLSKIIGHVDFYPNGGSAPQPGCLLYKYGVVDVASCSHTRSYKLFRESINSKGFVSKECESLKKYENGDCRDNKELLMGENCDTTGRGVYYLTTYGQEPFAKN